MWLREDGTPYYVGKGQGNRGLSSRGHRVRCPEKSHILLQEHPSEEVAHVVERFFISYYGRLDMGTGCLANLTDGGEGHSNPSDTTRKKLSDSKLGNTLTKGRTQSEDAKRKIGKAHETPHPWAAKLTESQVIEMRNLYARGDISQRALARWAGIDHKSVGKLLRRETWRHICPHQKPSLQAGGFRTLKATQ